MRTNLSLSALAAIAAVVLSANVASANDRVAVRSIGAKGVEASAAATIEGLLCSAIADQSFDVVCPSDIEALMQNKAQAVSFGASCDSDDCLDQIAKIADAKKIVVGELSRLGDTFVLSLSLVDPAGDKVVNRASEKAAKLEEFLDKVPAVAKKLMKK